MVPPPSAVIAPNMQTPAQSMLRLPAASAAVIDCAATAMNESTCSTESVGGMVHIEKASWNRFGTLGIDGSSMNRLQHWRGTSARASHCLQRLAYALSLGGLTEEL